MFNPNKIFNKKVAGRKILPFYPIAIGFLLFTFYLCSCKQVNLYERIQNVPKAAWSSDFKPSFSFLIQDTAALYNLYVTIRHTNSYPFNNIWLLANLQLPGDTAKEQKLELPLAANDKWLGIGMDDIYEQRIKLVTRPVQFKRSGTAVFSLQNIMRQDPLPGIMQVGVRVEKVEN